MNKVKNNYANGAYLICAVEDANGSHRNRPVAVSVISVNDLFSKIHVGQFRLGLGAGRVGRHPQQEKRHERHGSRRHRGSLQKGKRMRRLFGADSAVKSKARCKSHHESVGVR